MAFKLNRHDPDWYPNPTTATAWRELVHHQGLPKGDYIAQAYPRCLTRPEDTLYNMITLPYRLHNAAHSIHVRLDNVGDYVPAVFNDVLFTAIHANGRSARVPYKFRIRVIRLNNKDDFNTAKTYCIQQLDPKQSADDPKESPWAVRNNFSWGLALPANSGNNFTVFSEVENVVVILTTNINPAFLIRVLSTLHVLWPTLLSPEVLKISRTYFSALFDFRSEDFEREFLRWAEAQELPDPKDQLWPAFENSINNLLQVSAERQIDIRINQIQREQEINLAEYWALHRQEQELFLLKHLRDFTQDTTQLIAALKRMPYLRYFTCVTQENKLYLRVAFSAPIKIFDQSMYRRGMQHSGSTFRQRWNTEEQFIANKVYDEEELLLYMSSVYDLRINETNTQDTLVRASMPEERLSEQLRRTYRLSKFISNPHYRIHCLGTHAREITEALRKQNFVTAVTQCAVAAQNINMSDAGFVVETIRKARETKLATFCLPGTNRFITFDEALRHFNDTPATPTAPTEDEAEELELHFD